MFDKILFDRNAFDRSVSSDGLSATFLGNGDAQFKFVIRTPISAALSGSGSLDPGFTVIQQLAPALSGGGDLRSNETILKMNIAGTIGGSCTFELLQTVITPIAGSVSGDSSMSIDNRMFFYQPMRSAMTGNGVFDSKPVLSTSFGADFNGIGDMKVNTIVFQLQISLYVGGKGEFIIRRIGAFNENVIELIGIDFKPGDTITIDTDLLQVLFGPIEDVSSVTTDSEFFELNPGENEIIIDIDALSDMDVTAIWQNRWL